MKRVAVVSPPGLRDALISMILSHNLSLSRIEVTTFSSALCELNDWFPNHPILPYPPSGAMAQTLSVYDTVIAAPGSMLTQEDNFGNQLILCEEETLDKTIPLADNLQKFCEIDLQLPYSEKSNGMVVPTGLTWRSHTDRVVIYPHSLKTQNNWPAQKFVKLGKELEKQGLSPFFCLAEKERESWKLRVPQEQLLDFHSLHELACFIFESGSMIGNDSGVGHLASALNIPTLSLFARKSYSQLWRPGWHDGIVVTPPHFLPGARLMQKYWKQLLSVRRVLRTYNKEIERYSPSP